MQIKLQSPTVVFLSCITSKHLVSWIIIANYSHYETRIPQQTESKYEFLIIWNDAYESS